jgi:hypothetical protein
MGKLKSRHIIYKMIIFSVTLLLFLRCRDAAANHAVQRSGSLKTRGLNISLATIYVNDESFYSDGEDVVFKFKVVNNSDSDVLFGSGKQPGNDGSDPLVLPTYTMSKSGPLGADGFYLLSDEFKTGAIKLGWETEGNDYILKANDHKSIRVWTNKVYLGKYFKVPASEDDKEASSDVLSFLSRGDYLMVCVSGLDSTIYMAQKSPDFKVIVSHSIVNDVMK